MASGKKRGKSKEFTAEGVELNRDVISTLAHELGGIASALDLRAAAMSRSIPEQDLMALREIAEEVRMATRAARFARGSDGFGMLNPARRQSFDEWWRLTGRFTGSVLPRGVSVEPRFEQVQLTSEQGSALTWIWLAACKQVGERGFTTPAVVRLTGGPGSNGKSVAILAAETEADRVGAPTRAPSRWSRYAAAIAKDLGIDPPAWEDDSGTLRWRVELSL